jgi:hypothetical protein
MSLSKPVLLIAAGVALLVLLIANGHLVYVAMTSQPGCVAHDRADGSAPTSPGRYAAAKPSC